MKIPVTIKETAGLPRRQWPAEIGLPLLAGVAPQNTGWVVQDEKGNNLPSQFKSLMAYDDKSQRAIHGVFLVDLEPDQVRALHVVAAKPQPGKDIITEEQGRFKVNTGEMQAIFNQKGELVSLVYKGNEVLDTVGPASLRLSLSLGPAGKSMAAAKRPPVLAVRIKESGPIRAILQVSGSIFLEDLRGEVEIKLDCDYVFYRGKSEIHVKPMLVGAVTESVMLSEWLLVIHLRNGKEMTYGRDIPLVRKDPNHENMTWRGLDQGWASWKTAGPASLTAWSPDFARHKNGIVRTCVTDRERDSLKIDFGRIESWWHYQDVNQPAKQISINRGSWRRWEAVFGLHDTPVEPQPLVQAWSHPLRAFASPEYYRTALTPWLEGVRQASPLWHKVADKCAEFVCLEPEYAGSLHGGWDSVNRMYLERGVSRGDFGEYLFNEFYRSAEQRFYRMGFDFGQIYRDIFCFTIPDASQGKHELGGARSRSSEYWACSIRSYRGAVLLAYMYQETGDERYLEAVRQRADYHLANYPHLNGRLSMGCRDTAFMSWYLGRPELVAKARENMAHSLDKHFDPQHGFYEEYDEKHPLPNRRFPAWPLPAGVWFMQDFLYTSNASPEMTAYNIIGWYGLHLLYLIDSTSLSKIRRICEWFRDKQNQDGSWPYPHDTSGTRWGHGCLQDAMAMLYAYKMFRDESFLISARKSIAFARDCFEKYGKIPLLLGLLPHEETEDSLTYYYGIETMAVYHELVGDKTYYV